MNGVEFVTSDVLWMLCIGLVIFMVVFRLLFRKPKR